MLSEVLIIKPWIMASVYTINKGVNKSVEFKGLKAQYIWYVGGGLMILMIVYAVMYICEVNTYLSLVIIMVLGSLLIACVYKLSNRYGKSGMMKMIARRSIPHVIKIYSRRDFLRLKKQ